MNKTYKIVLVIVLMSIVILVIGSSYAYFKAIITGDSEAISIKSGKMELTFNDGNSEVSLPNAKPGDYMVKDFNVENTSTINSTYDYEYIYNIKLVDVEVTFQKEDLEYKLEEYTDETYTELKPNGVDESGYINAETITEEKEMYIAARITRPPKGEKHYFRLTITFKNLENVNQNYNQGAEFSAKINIDDNKDPLFGSNDIELAVYVDGVKQYDVPEKGTAYYDGIECSNNSTINASWDYKDWELNINLKTKLPNKCVVNFTKQTPSLIETLKYISATTQSVLVDDETEQHNLRYIGQVPNNYVWFNCNDYSEEMNESNCEKWRIIGLFRDIKIVSGENTTRQDLVKIIRADSVGDIAWDTSNSNNWTNATLKPQLEGYYNGTELSSTKGITSATQGMIEQVTWNLGGPTSYATIITSQVYTAERGSTVPSGASATWDGYIGLMYPSDYGYATSGGGSTDRDACLAKALYSWDGSPYKADCAGNDWLWNANTTQWTITPYSPNSSYVFYVNAGGYAAANNYNLNYYASLPFAILPSLYLKSSVKVVDGNGSSAEPYILTQKTS